MSASWSRIRVTPGYGANNNGQTNYPTQKSVGILGVQAGEFAPGAVIVSVVDFDADIDPYVFRRFFIREVGSANWQLLPMWIPATSGAEATKPSTVSFVIVGTKIYAITNVIGSVDVQGTYIGIYDLADGTTGTWDTTTYGRIHSSGSNFDIYPDIDKPSSDDGLLAVWTDTNSKAYSRAISFAIGLGALRESTIINGGGDPRASVLSGGSYNFYIHCAGYVAGGSGTSSLYYGQSGTHIISTEGLKASDVDLPDGQIGISTAGHLGIVAKVSNEVIFNFYNPAVGLMNGAETIAAEIGTLAFGYGLTYRNDKWYCVYFDVAGDEAKVRHRLEGITQAWNVENLGTGYPTGQNLDYFSCQNTPNPPAIDVDYWGFICLATDTLFPFFRGSGDPIPPPLPVGNYYNDGMVYSAGAIDISTVNGAFARRGTLAALEFLKVMDHIQLSDDSVVFIDGSRAWKFDKDSHTYGDAPVVLEWESGEDPDNMPYQEWVWFRMVFDLSDPDATFTVNFYNENSDDPAKTQEMSASDSGQEIWVGINGRRFSYGISHTENTDIAIRDIMYHTERIE